MISLVWDRINRMKWWREAPLQCPCGGYFFTLHGAWIDRHPRRFVYSRLGMISNYVTCETCSKKFSASSYMMLDEFGRPDPWSWTLTRGGKVPRWVEKEKERRMNEIKVELAARRGRG